MTQFDVTRRKSGRQTNQLTFRVIELHHEGRTPREIARMEPVSDSQIRGILRHRGLAPHPEARRPAMREYPVGDWGTARERATDALCESGEVDRRAMAYRVTAMGGTAAMIVVVLDCGVEEAEQYMRDCPANWTVFI